MKHAMGPRTVSSKNHRKLSAHDVMVLEREMMAECRRRLADPDYCRTLEQLGVELWGDWTNEAVC
jgi:hypothetical protein